MLLAVISLFLELNLPLFHIILISNQKLVEILLSVRLQLRLVLKLPTLPIFLRLQWLEKVVRFVHGILIKLIVHDGLVFLLAPNLGLVVERLKNSLSLSLFLQTIHYLLAICANHRFKGAFFRKCSILLNFHLKSFLLLIHFILLGHALDSELWSDHARRFLIYLWVVGINLFLHFLLLLFHLLDFVLFLLFFDLGLRIESDPWNAIHELLFHLILLLLLLFPFK